MIKNLGDTFGGGVVSMARNCKAAVSLVRNETWSLDDMERWLDAVITSDPKYPDEANLKSLRVKVRKLTDGYIERNEIIKRLSKPI